MDLKVIPVQHSSCGPWQITLFIILSVFMMLPSCWHTLGYIFQAYTPPHHCHVSKHESDHMNRTIPWDAHRDAYSMCDVYVNSSVGNETVACSDTVNEWDYFGRANDTIVSEWNLVCDRDYLKKSTSTVFALGIIVGTAFFAPLHDHFGRRPVFLACQWLVVAIGVWNAFVYNFYLYLAVRFLLGFLRPGYATAGFIMACELFPAKYRTFAGIIIEDFWAVGICLLALMMYFIPNWRHLQLIVSLFGLLSVPLFWFLPESVPWLVSKGRFEEAERIVQNSGHIHFVQRFPCNVLDERMKDGYETKRSKHDVNEDGGGESLMIYQGEEKAVRKELINRGACTMMDVLRHAKLRLFLAIISLLWFINATVYFGMTLNTEELAGNRHLNLFFSGLVEIPAYTLSYFIVNRWGRRIPLVGLGVFAGVFLILSHVVPIETGSSLLLMKLTFTMLGKFCVTASLGIVILYASELFPTSVRSQSSGVAAFCGYVGGLIAPFTSSRNAYTPPWTTPVILGIVSIAGAWLVLILPETNKRPLPQTIEDVERWSRSPAAVKQRSKTDSILEQASFKTTDGST